MARRIALTLTLSLAMLTTGLFRTDVRLASAQTDSPSIFENGPVAEGAAVADANEVTSDGKTKPPQGPSYCKPCLYYSGDSNLGTGNWSGRAEGNNLSFGVNYVYLAFTVPANHTWKVNGLILNMVNAAGTGGIVDPPMAGWSIWHGTAVGVPGTLLAGGVDSTSASPNGRKGGGFTEYTVKVKLKSAVKLQSGTYFVNVLPQCTDAGNTACTQTTYLSDVESLTPNLQFGPANIVGNSFFYSALFSENFSNTAAGDIQQVFSFGIEGSSAGH